MKQHGSLHLNSRLLLLLLLFCLFEGKAQTIPGYLVQGRIVDTNGMEVVGAAVKIIDASLGTITNADGYFSLRVPHGAILEISYIGYVTKIVKVTSNKPMVVTLEEKNVQLEDVVVVGYGSSSKEKITGSVVSVSTTDFKNRPITNVSMALQGKLPGLQVTQNSGQPGSDEGTINIRGIGTLNDSSPLIIVDGFESSFDKVDPKDIESISVLKDAASAAIYGNKAANGVILITTKKGRTGKMSIEYNGYLAIQNVTRYPELLGSIDYMELYNEACTNSGIQKKYSEEYINHFRNQDSPAVYPSRDWADFYFKPAPQQNHYLKVSGGSEALTYNLSVGYLNQKGILEGTEYSKYNFRSNTISSFFSNKLKIGTGISGYFGVQKDLVSGSSSTLSRIIQMHPYVIPKLEGYGWTGWFYNDAVREAGGGQKLNTNNLTGNANLQLQLLPHLKLEGAVSYDYNTQFGRTYAPDVELYDVVTGADGNQFIDQSNSTESQIKESTYRYSSFSSWATLNYWFNLKEDYHFKVMGGWQAYKWSGKYYDTERKRLTANLPALGVGDPATQKNSAWETETTSLSFFGRFNYDYKYKYLFEANVRYDGSSKFAADHKWGLFPSFSIGWRLSEERFLKNKTSWLDELKLRVSWGKLGNEKINSSYAGTDILSIGTSNYIWNNLEYTGAATSYIANKDLSWETTMQTNMGLDLALFKSLTFAVDFYVKETSDILMQLPVSSTYGYVEIPYQNAGKMRNAGFEFSLSYLKRLNSDWEISCNGNISYNKNKILDLKGQSPIISDRIILKEGYPINTLYGYETEGIYQSENEIHNHLKTFDRYGNVVNSYSGLIAQPGDIRFKDQNGDGIIDLDNDRVPLGNPFPDITYSLTLACKWKDFDFTAFFQGVAGGEGWSMGELVSPFYNSYNSASWMVNRWTLERPNNTYQRVYIDNQRADIRSAYYVEDMSYLRLKNIEVGYTIPVRWLHKIGLKGTRIFVSGQNLFTITPYEGFDPERAGVNATNIYDYPLLKTYTFGINITL